MSKTKLLIVEDESIVALDIKQRAENLGYEVVDITSTGEEAIDKTEKFSPDLILMDIVLKGDMDGIEAAQIIRSNYKKPIIYLTAYSDEKTIQRAKLTGPFGYITKPFEDRELHSAIEVALYKHEMDNKLRENEERYRCLFEFSPDSILILDFQGKIKYTNQQMEKVLGINRSKIIDKSLNDFTQIELVDKYKFSNLNSIVLQLLEKEEIGAFEVIVKKEEDDDIYLEMHASSINPATNKPLFQVIGHDITDRIKAEEHKMELYREKAWVELYGFLVSAIPVFASSIPPKLRNTIIRNFADRFEKNLKPNFYQQMAEKGLLKNIRGKSQVRSEEILEEYLKWIRNFLSNLGIKTRINSTDSKYRLIFETFPWKEESQNNPIFALIFRTMIIRSFTWTGIKGNVKQSPLSDITPKMQFDFFIA